MAGLADVGWETLKALDEASGIGGPSVSEYAQDVWREGNLAYDAVTDALLAIPPAEVTTGLSVPIAGLGSGIANIFRGDISARPGVLDYPDIYQQNIGPQREANKQAQEILATLIQFGMSPRDAEIALAENFQTRPMSTQILGGLLDPLPPGIAAMRLAPGMARGARQAVGGIQDILKVPVARAGGDLIPSMDAVLSMSPDEIARYIVMTQDEIVVRQGQPSADLLVAHLRELQARLDLPAPVTFPEDVPPMAPGTSVQGGLGGEFGTPTQQVRITETGLSQDPVPLIDADAILGQQAEAKLLADAEAAGQQRLGGLGETETFFRGINPGDERRIPTVFDAAEGRTFVARTEGTARAYGSEITRFESRPGARILHEEDVEFWRLLGLRRPPNSSVFSTGRKPADVINDAIRKAEEAGYDAVSFSRDSDIGTVILNEDAFIRQSIEDLGLGPVVPEEVVGALPSAAVVPEEVIPPAAVVPEPEVVSAGLAKTANDFNEILGGNEGALRIDKSGNERLAIGTKINRLKKAMDDVSPEDQDALEGWGDIEDRIDDLENFEREPGMTPADVREEKLGLWEELVDAVDSLEIVPPAAAAPSPAVVAPAAVTPPVAAVPEGAPLRFDPQTNRYNGDELVPGTLLTDDAGTMYRVDRRLGFMLTLDELKPDGSFARTISYSVDRSDTSRYKALYKAEEITPPAAAVPGPVAAALPSPAVADEMVVPRFVETSKPRYRDATPEFDSPLDKALFIVARPGRRSAKDEDFMRFAMDATGLSRVEVRAAGREIREAMKGLYVEGVDTFRVPRQYLAEAARAPIEQAAIPQQVGGLGIGEIPTGPGLADDLDPLIPGVVDDAFPAPSSVTEGIANRLQEIDVELEAIKFRVKIVRPPWKGRYMSNDTLIQLAAHEGRNPYEKDWWDGIDSALVSTFRREPPAKLLESRQLDRAPTPQELRQERRRLREDLARSEAADLTDGGVGEVVTAAQAGDTVRIMGRNTNLATSYEVGNIRYELFTGEDPADLGGYYRVTDIESGKVVTVKRNPDQLEAFNEFDETVHAAYGGRPFAQVLDEPIHGLDDIPDPVVSAPTGEPSVAPGGAVGGAPPPDLPPTVPGGDPPFDFRDPIAWFRRFLAEPQRVEDWRVTKEWRRRARAIRAADYGTRLTELLNEGVRGEEALRRVAAETLSGALPTADTGIQNIATDIVRAALFERLARFDFGRMHLQRPATFTALVNALAGRAIPDTPVSEGGGTAMSLLKRVFGDEIAKALDVDMDLATIIATRRSPQAKPGAAERKWKWGEGFRDYDDLRFNPQAVPARDVGPPPARDPVAPDLRHPVDIGMYNNALRHFTENKLQSIRSLSAAEKTRLARLSKEDFLSEMRRILGPSRPLPAPRRPGFVEGGIPTQHPLTEPQGFENLEWNPQAVLARDAFPGPVSPSRTPEEIEEGHRRFTQAMYDQERHIMSGGDMLTDGFKQLGLGAYDVGNLVRANVSSWDMSFLRQNSFLIVGNLPEFRAGLVAFKRAAVSATDAQQMARLRQRGPDWDLYNDLKLDFQRPLDQAEAEQWRKFEGGAPGSAPARQAEEFPGQGGTRPIQKLQERLPWIRVSGRAHISALNEMNWQIWVKHLRSLEKYNLAATRGEIGDSWRFGWKRGTLEGPGGQLLPRFTKVKAAPLNVRKEMKAIGEMLEDMTGRAQLGPLRELSPAMNAGFFSLRLNLGRVLTPRHLFMGTARSRKQAWKNVVATLTTFTGVLYAGHRMGLWDLEFDRRSADFMKIRIGKIRIDPWGGYQQFVTFAARMMPLIGGVTSTETGQTREANIYNTPGRLLRSKFSPMASMMFDFTQGETFLGEKLDVTDRDQWLDRLLPFSLNDFWEAYQSEGIKGAALAIPGIVGAGILAYELPRWPELDEYYQLQGQEPVSPYHRPPSTSKLRKDYRRANPEAEARLFVRGDVETVQTSRAKLFILQIMREHGVNERDVPGFEKTFGRKTLGAAIGQNGTAAPGRGTTWQDVGTSIENKAPGLYQRLGDIWFPRPGATPGSLTSSERAVLEEVYRELPMGQLSFDIWYSTLKNLVLRTR